MEIFAESIFSNSSIIFTVKGMKNEVTNAYARVYKKIWNKFLDLVFNKHTLLILKEIKEKGGDTSGEWFFDDYPWVRVV